MVIYFCVFYFHVNIRFFHENGISHMFVGKFPNHSSTFPEAKKNNSCGVSFRWYNKSTYSTRDSLKHVHNVYPAAWIQETTIAFRKTVDNWRAPSINIITHFIKKMHYCNHWIPEVLVYNSAKFYVWKLTRKCFHRVKCPD